MKTAGKHSTQEDVDVVIVENIEDYIDYIKIQRGITDKEIHLRWGYDNGNEFYKVTVNAMVKSPEESSKEIYGSEYKDTGVKRLNIIGLAHNIKESYANVRKINKECKISKLNHVPHTHTGDQKILICFCGKPGSSCGSPCGHCDAKQPLTLERPSGKLYTLGILRGHHRRFKAAGSPKKKQADYDNVVNEVLFDEDDEEYVIDIFPPPVLHLKLRTVNHICDHLSLQTQKHCGCDLVLEFAKEENIVRKSYHGGNYQGNQCNDIMKKVDKLEQKLPRKLRKFTKCLRKFKVIVDETFGCEVKVTLQEILDMMEDFKKCYLPLKISVTPTVHDVYFHVPDWYERNGLERGLGWYSEQATESCHRDFMSNVWLKGYKVPDTHPEYPNKLQGAIAKYNSRRIV